MKNKTNCEICSDYRTYLHEIKSREERIKKGIKKSQEYNNLSGLEKEEKEREKEKERFYKPRENPKKRI